MEIHLLRRRADGTRSRPFKSAWEAALQSASQSARTPTTTATTAAEGVGADLPTVEEMSGDKVYSTDAAEGTEEGEAGAGDSYAVEEAAGEEAAEEGLPIEESEGDSSVLDEAGGAEDPALEGPELTAAWPSLESEFDADLGAGADAGGDDVVADEGSGAADGEIDDVVELDADDSSS